MASISDASNALSLARSGSWLIARFDTPQRCLSWAIVGGGFHTTHAVAWLEVRNADLPRDVDPIELLRDRMTAQGLDGGVGLITSRQLDAFVDVSHSHAGQSARCIATVGLGNALRAGDAPNAIHPLGTINILCHVSQPLADHALLEALALASEAKSLAVREAEVPSFANGMLASGTGTDCIVVACPSGHASAASPYAGKHTTVGHLIGHTVYSAVHRGALAWKAEPR